MTAEIPAQPATDPARDRDHTRIWIAVLPALVVPFIGAMFYFVWMAGNPFSRALYVCTKIFTLGWPIFAFVVLFKEHVPRPHWTQPASWKSLPLGIVSGVVITAAMVGLLFTPIGDVVQEGGPDIVRKCKDLGILEHFWLFAFFVAVIHSLLEEYFWRWFVYGQLAHVIPGWRAHLLAGLAFTLHHVVILNEYFGLGWSLFFSFFVGVGGIIWSIMLHHQKTLLGTWVSHMIVDFGCMGIGYWLILQVQAA